MQLTFVDHFSYQTRVSIHLNNRDTIKRLASAMMIMTICWQFTDPMTAYFWSAVIVFSELVGRSVGRHFTLAGPQMPLHICAVIWLLNVLNLLPLLVPTVLLAGHGSDAMLTAAFLWLFGLYVHISNNYASLPIYNWSLMLPTFGGTILMFRAAYSAPIVPATNFEWIAAAAMLLVYVVNTFETMSSQKDTLTQLATARKDADKRLEELEFMTQHDHLTGLMNRRAFEKAATDFLPRRRNRDRGHMAYFLIDLDGFKPINDSYSHKAGDAVLVGVADRLKAVIGKSGIVARLGGDEFAVALPAVRDRAHALRLADKMAKTIKEPIVSDHRQLAVGASIGIALTTTTTDTLAGLASGADQAMYRAKQDPGKSVDIYDKDSFPVRASLDERATILRAMQKRNITPFYQPKININTGRITGFEALSRWHHPQRGLLLPGRFLPFINELGLQGDFLIHTTTCVLDHIEELLDQGLNPGEVSVNLPEVTLATLRGRADLLELMAKYPRATKKLTFEVTEDVFIARSGNLIQESIAIFREHGVRISLDDFGTGFASFKHLRELEFDELKLDTGFVRGLGHDKAAEVLVRGFLNIGEGLGVDVIAEGVENQTQLDLLRQMGCQICQGFYYSPAMPYADAYAALRRQERLGVPFTPPVQITKSTDAA